MAIINDYLMSYSELFESSESASMETCVLRLRSEAYVALKL